MYTRIDRSIVHISAYVLWVYAIYGVYKRGMEKLEPIITNASHAYMPSVRLPLNLLYAILFIILCYKCVLCVAILGDMEN